TLTTGSLQGCLHRGTDLSKHQIDLIVKRLDLVVTTVNTAKHLVLKMIEMRILRELLPKSPSPAQSQECSQEGSFLEKILDSDWAETLVGNLLSYVLRGSTSAMGPKPKKEMTQDALAQAVLTFEEFKVLHPGLEAINPSKLPLGIVTDDLAPKICLDLKMHFRKLPQTLRAKMKKLSIDPLDLSDEEQPVEENDSVDDTAVEENDDDDDPRKKSKKIVFEPGHIQSCWDHLMRLPVGHQPRFCIQPKMTDSFLDIREESLMRILWGREAGEVGQIWEGSPFTNDWVKNQMNSLGNIIKTLFIGDQAT
ncbi:hypothetical protein BGZ70_005929, partial [Mortierella alpina]